MSRYIHLNPVRVSVTRKQTDARRQAALRDYRWSSYRAMIGLTKADEWLVTKDTLSRWGTGVREQQRGNEARQVAMWLAHERCGAVTTVRETGKMMGGVNGAAVVVAHRRIPQRLTRDTHLRRIVAMLS